MRHNRAKSLQRRKALEAWSELHGGFLGRSPDSASADDLRRFQLHQRQNGVQPASMNSAVSALRFFFGVTLDRPDMERYLTFVSEPRKLPVVLSPEEIAWLLNAAPGLKYKAALSVAYGAGLRAAEVVALKIADIDSKRMILRIEQGKGGKDRNVMLSPHLLQVLRTWWMVERPQGWLFPGRNPVQPMTTRQLNRACHAAAPYSGLRERSLRIPVRKLPGQFRVGDRALGQVRLHRPDRRCGRRY